MGRLQQSLPEPYRADPATGAFLEAFEHILLGGAELQNAAQEPLLGLEQVIDAFATYLSPGGDPEHPSAPQAPEVFLPWLARWLAFSLRADLPPAVRRSFLRNLTLLYRWRGTEQSLRRVIEYFTGLPSTDSTVTVSETDPYCFEVTVDLSLIAQRSLLSIPRLLETTHALIRREKPAHTRYTVAPIFRSFRIGERYPDETKNTKFFAQVHGQGPDPNDPNQTIEVGNTLLGSSLWEK